MKIASGSDFLGNKAGIKVVRNMYMEAMEINSANKKSSIILLENRVIPIEEIPITKIAKIKGILRCFIADQRLLFLGSKFLPDDILQISNYS